MNAYCFAADDVPMCGPKAMLDCANWASYEFTIANMAAECQCPRQCRQLTYTNAISQAVFSDHAVEWARENVLPNMTGRDIRHNFAAVQVVRHFCTCAVPLQIHWSNAEHKLIIIGITWNSGGRILKL